MATHFTTTGSCQACGQRTLVQEWLRSPTDAGAEVSERAGLPRCVNPHCVKADLVGWAHGESPRAQRG